MDDELLKGHESILLVDDEEMIIDVSQQMLKMLGYRVYTARSGAEALTAYQQLHDCIDIVILDLMMPDMDGKDVYKRLQEMDPDVAVLFASGYDLDSESDEVASLNCEGFIQKPFNLKKLSFKIREALDKDTPLADSTSPQMVT